MLDTLKEKTVKVYCRVQAATAREDGIEMTEVAGLIAIFVVVCVVAFGTFGGQMGTFVNGLPKQLGF
ncbi:MAG: hypothetical protein KKA73_12425 [Chloroflexi bacterium]|nr:hypothetical protein [Chloroflexota bacterium]MBU1748488.1 hypothetical protein [Chloroflexota bacterium]MBU1878113.1 hypothetical protein [Chloroflexota bacterium]